MGRNLARNLARHGHTVALHNRTHRAHPNRSSRSTATRARSSRPSRWRTSSRRSSSRARSSSWSRPASRPTRSSTSSSPLLDDGDIVIDCGNAHFADTRRREAALREHGLHFVGCGVSGGEEGALLGPSIMPGGSKRVLREARPDLRVDRRAGRRHPVLRARRPGRRRALRQDGAQRHRVRRHAADRRGLRPAARRASARRRREIAEIFRDVERGRPRVVPDRDHRRRARRTPTPTTGKPFVDIVLDQAEQKGTGRWTVQSALDLGVPITGIAEATFARALSGHAEQRGAGAAGVRHRTSATLDDRRPRRVRRGRPRARCTRRRWSPTRRASTTSRPAARSTTGTSTAARWRRSGAAAASSGPGSSTGSSEAYDDDADLPSLLVAPYFADAVRDGRRLVAAGGVAGRAGRHPDAGVLVVARLLRRAAPRAAAGRADPGPARQLRRAHLPARRPRRARSTPCGPGTSPSPRPEPTILPPRAGHGVSGCGVGIRFGGRIGSISASPVRRGPVHGAGTASSRRCQRVRDGLVVDPPAAEVRPRLLGRALHAERRLLDAPDTLQVSARRAAAARRPDPGRARPRCPSVSAIGAQRE